MTQDLFAVGLELAALGMGTVFAFLTLLVLVTKLMSGVVRRFPGSVSAEHFPPVNLSRSQPSASVLAAIGAAVRRYRDDRAS